MSTQPVDELAELLADVRCLLLDFDGPICAIFAGRPTRSVVTDLLDTLASHGITPPEPVQNARDPFDVLRYAATISPDLAANIEARLQANEIIATRSARPTQHAAYLIDTWRQSGRALAIVSNNSAAAVESYLSDHDISVDQIAARTSADPQLLKPSPHLIAVAVHSLGTSVAACALVGDSKTDITAARVAGVASIGYANKPGKRDTLANAGADVVINDMAALVRAVAIALA